MKRKIAIVSLGCAKNLVDSEMAAAMFPKENYEIVHDPGLADVVLVNTCGFIEKAKAESIETILSLTKGRAPVVAMGCLVERYLEDLRKELPEVALFVPIRDYGNLHREVERLLEAQDLKEMNPLRRIISTAPYTAYLRISEGCDNRCSFCAIPLIRGPFRSRPFNEIITEAKGLLEKGVKEVSIISQDTTSYGRDFMGKRPNFLDLLKALDELGFYSIRLLYLYPGEIDDETIDFISSSKSVAPYFDIPIQAASERLLKLMNRHASKEETVELLEKIRRKLPKAPIRTTLIAGFPNEREEDHQEVLSLMKKIRFDHLGCFIYSREEGTAAYSKVQVPFSRRERRFNEIMALQKEIAKEKHKERIGEVMEGLVIGQEGDEYLVRTYWNAPDEIDGRIYMKPLRKHEMGEIVRLRIDDSTVYDLKGTELAA